MKKIHIIISGIVTGVGFRWWLKKKATEKNIYGWVKNKTKNEVEALFLGKEKDVDNIKHRKHKLSLKCMSDVTPKVYNDRFRGWGFTYWGN